MMRTDPSSTHVEDTICIDIKYHLDLRNPTRCGRDPVEQEPAELAVVVRHLPFALERSNLDLRLIVCRGGNT